MKKEDLFNAISDINPKYIEEINLDNKRVKKHTSPALIAAAIALFVASPFIVNAATNGDFFNRIWGTAGRQDIPSHVEYVEDKGEEIPIVYPQQDFVDVDPELAEDLIGSNVEYLSIVREIDGVTITILSAVRDENNAVVVEFTLEKEGGVDCLNYSQLDNESKGAWFSDDSTFYFRFGNSSSSSKIFVDLENSTDEKLYCYSYIICNGGVWLNTYQYPCTLGEFRSYSVAGNDEECIRIESEIEEHSVLIPCGEIIEVQEFTSSEGGVIHISPISMMLNYSVGLNLSDMYGIYNITITYSDGSTYLVEEHSNYEYECETDTANFNYSCGGLNSDAYYLFNRLVDVDTVSSITVNGVEYTR